MHHTFQSHEQEADSQVIFLGDIPIKGVYHVASCTYVVVYFASDSELDALYLNIKQGNVLQLALIEMCHHQPTTPVHCDNSTAAESVNNIVKNQRSRSMVMQFFLVIDQVTNKEFDGKWHLDNGNLVDYLTRYFNTKHHQSMQPWFVHEKKKTLQKNFYKWQRLKFYDGVLEY